MVRLTDAVSAASKLKVFEVNEVNQSYCTPSCIRTGSLTSIVALVSNRAVFISESCHVVELSVASPRVTVSCSEDTLTPGALITTVCVR